MADFYDMISAIRKRWQHRLEDGQFRTDYEAWLRDPRTVAITDVMREALYRPALPQAVLSGDSAIFAQGFSEGVFSYHDCMLNLRPEPKPEELKEPDYGREDLEAAKDEQQKERSE
jgi:hypothetical protein